MVNATSARRIATNHRDQSRIQVEDEFTERREELEGLQLANQALRSKIFELENSVVGFEGIGQGYRAAIHKLEERFKLINSHDVVQDIESDTFSIIDESIARKSDDICLLYCHTPSSCQFELPNLVVQDKILVALTCKMRGEIERINACNEGLCIRVGELHQRIFELKEDNEALLNQIQALESFFAEETNHQTPSCAESIEQTFAVTSAACPDESVQKDVLVEDEEEYRNEEDKSTSLPEKEQQEISLADTSSDGALKEQNVPDDTSNQDSEVEEPTPCCSTPGSLSTSRNDESDSSLSHEEASFEEIGKRLEKRLPGNLIELEDHVSLLSKIQEIPAKTLDDEEKTQETDLSTGSKGSTHKASPPSGRKKLRNFFGKQLRRGKKTDC